MSIVIECKNVTKSFDVNGEHVTALNDVSFSINQGEFVMIHGSSGSGKSTLLDTILGLQPPNNGDVTVAGKDLYALNSAQQSALRAQHFGVVYQRSYWVSSLNVVDNVGLPLLMLGASRKEAKRQAVDKLAEFELDRFANYDPQLLSGGQQQRVSLARALMTNPEIIVADEPTGSLDRVNSEKIIDYLLDICSNLGRTVVMVTHNLEFLSLTDHHLMMEDGNLLNLRRSDAKS